MITLENFIGNEDFIRLLQISIAAAKDRNSALPHTLMKGPAGCGKTTLAEAVARAFGTKPMALTPATARKTDDLRKLFLRMPGEGYDQEGRIIGKIQPQIVFVDEVHQLPLKAQENLGIAMQDWKLPVNVQGQDVFEWVPRFTLIGATTLPGKLSKPFLDRFKIQSEFETYSRDEAIRIARIHAGTQELTLGPGVPEAIANRSRGVPRLVVRFLDRLADAALVAGRTNPTYRKVITVQLAEAVFRDFLKVDDRGLTKTDIKILKQLSKLKDPVGLDTLATIANEDTTSVERTIEPHLIHEGLLVRTKRGRILTDEGRRYLESAGYIEAGPNVLRTGRLMGAPRNEQ
jgi:Holliday junction DNA helicase RuvB